MPFQFFTLEDLVLPLSAFVTILQSRETVELCSVF